MDVERKDAVRSAVEQDDVDLNMYPVLSADRLNLRSEVKMYSVQPKPVKLFEESKFTTDVSVFNTSSTQYNRQLAYFLSVISGWSYSDGDTFTAKLQYYGLQGATVTEIKVVNEAMAIVATANFIMTLSGVGILSFRGTEPANIINWLTDSNTMMRPFLGGQVHSGFLNNTKALWSQIIECIQGAPNLETLYLTGHSLGAAMAGVAAMKLSEDNPAEWQKVKGIYTFGQPMIANRTLAKLCDERFGQLFYRHVYARDVVPRVPSRDLGDYAHFGIERFAKRPFDQWKIRDTGQQTKQSRFIFSTISGVGFSFLEKRLKLPLLDTIANVASQEIFLSMDDHSPINYIETCHQAL